MKKLFTLFVGINDYQGRFNSLRGCVRDINHLEDVVQEQYANLFEHHHLRLVDKDATYKNIVDGFQNHLRQAGPEDTVWFHYSGHGTEEPCADEFLSLEPSGKDQNLICFDTWDGYAPYLADKELAVLINQVATETVSGESKESPHIVISLDCCHSGSGTRSAGEDLILPRSAEPQGIKREITTYLDGYYASQKNNINVPSSRHVLLAACESVQLAGDSSNGGIFTVGLVEALRRSKGEINYSDLFMLTRSTVAAKNKNQSPQFQTIDNFNPYTKFLEGSNFGTPDRYEVVDDGDWYVKCGAIHGLPTNSQTPLEIEIQDPKKKFETIGKGTIKSVGAQRSKIDLDLDSGLKSFFKNLVPSSDSYVAVFNHFPAPPFYVKLSGEAQQIQEFEEKWSTAKNIRLASESDQAHIEVDANSKTLKIIDHEIPQEAYSLETNVPESVEIILDHLETIAKWKRMSSLRNKQTRSKLQKMVSLEMEVVNKKKEVESFSGPTARILAAAENSYDTSRSGGADLAQILHPFVVVNEAPQKLYFYLFQLENDYSIICHEEEKVLPENQVGQKNVRIPLWTNKMRGWGLMPGQQSLTTQFKLLVTTEQLDYLQLTQAGLSSSRGSTMVIQEDLISDDWWMIDMDVTMIRQDGQINAQESVVLANGSIVIEPHQTFTGKVGVGNASGGSRSASSSVPFSLSSRQGFERINFNASRSAMPQDLLEIEGIHPTVVAGLQEQPLKIKLATKLNENESMLPVAFDGQYYQIVGDAQQDGDQTLVNIRSVPDGEQTTKRGIFKSLKLAFFKVGLKKTEGINEFRRAEVSPDGSVEYTISEMGSKLVSAKKTLLVVHGLLGDTSSILKSLNRQQPELLNTFDLILTFDYENLTQSLSETATIMSDLIKDAGVGKNTENNLTILAHGSGGLIARQYIERMDGSSLVDHLIMVGTPNNGTNTGKLDTFREVSVSSMELALNFVPQLVPYSGLVLTGLRKLGSIITNKISSNLGDQAGAQVDQKVNEVLDDDLGKRIKSGAEALTGSLRDMIPTAQFINDLNSSDDPGVLYTIIAGDAKSYAQSVPGFSGFLEKTKMTLGRGLHGPDHDLFSSEASIENKDTWSKRNPAPRVFTKLKSHHYNYFELNASVWKQLFANDGTEVLMEQADTTKPKLPEIGNKPEELQVDAKVEEGAVEIPKVEVPMAALPVMNQMAETPSAPPQSNEVAQSTEPKVEKEESIEASGDIEQKIDNLTQTVAKLSEQIERLEKKLSNGKITFD